LRDGAQTSQRLAAFYAVTARLTSATSVDDVLIEVGRSVGQAIPRVGEVSVAEWDARRGVIRDLIEFRPWTNRRVPLPPPGVHPVAGLREMEAVLSGTAPYLQSRIDEEGISDAHRAYMR